jgi:PilZ domain-containing protein
MRLEGVNPDAPSNDSAMTVGAAPGSARRGPALRVEPAATVSSASPEIAAIPIVDGYEVVRRMPHAPLHSAPPALDARVGEFLEAFRILLRSSRLYQRNHPRWVESLNSAEHRLRDALAAEPSVQIRIERDTLTVAHGDASTPHGLPILDAHGDLKSLAEEFTRCGIASLEFLQTAHLGELDLLSQQIVWVTRQRPISADLSAAMWTQWLRDAHVSGIRINVPAGRRDETVLATLVAVLLGYGGATDIAGTEDRASSPASREQTIAALGLVERLAELGAQRGATAEEAARRAHAVLGETERGAVALLARAVSIAPRDVAANPSSPAVRGAQRDAHDSLPSFLNRAADHLILDFARRSLSEGRMQPAEISTLLSELARVPGARSGAWVPLGSDEGRVAAIVERFWDTLPAHEKQRIMRGADAWCVPPAVLARHLAPMLAAPRGKRADAPEREARALLLAYAACLESEEPRARRAVAAGLGELDWQIAQLWPHEDAEGLAPLVVRALAREESPGISGLLAALTERLAKRSLEGRHYSEFDRILSALESAAHDSEQSHFSTLVRGIATDDAWFYLVEDALANRALDPVLPRLLRREPARLLDRLALLLTAPEGADLLPAMVRLVRATGEPVLATLATHLREPHRQPALTAIKLLAEADPIRLIAALPRALPSWDWNLQDLAVSELSRHHEPALALRISRAFFECVEESHHLVVPSMLDYIGLAGDASAIPLLLQIAGGSHATLRDIFFRIKSVEALGRMRAADAPDLLRTIARSRSGLSYIEPAGLRSAAEEALALLENHPAAARVRARTEALEKSARPYSQPRRYQRIPLASYFSARIAGSVSGTARIRTIGLGGAFVQSAQQMSVGDSFKVQIRTGLRSIRSTAVVRNISPEGGGVEFVHMKAEDREQLRRVIGRLLR